MPEVIDIVELELAVVLDIKVQAPPPAGALINPELSRVFCAIIPLM